ncbi:orotate phosphoribosyltransferase [Catelliglobosispora koreensis]|uniref:orotate phosphoribosyltransferase n=1 Tax=Catelliglobosispora koreensis TaxID=129052 RepID=UPI00037B66E6|nr:orotate phosphoribosyltransferase [Catelliglobosispora koreensis]
MSARDELRKFITDLAVVRGSFVLSSGATSDWYLDMRRLTLDHRAAPLVGQVLNELTADWQFEAVGGLTMGADPVAAAMMHTSNRPLDAFVVRKADKVHGLQRRIEGPDVSGRKVLAVEDVNTTGSSVLTAVDALRNAGAEVIGVAVIVDRGAGEAVRTAGLSYRAAYTLADLDLSA